MCELHQVQKRCNVNSRREGVSLYRWPSVAAVRYFPNFEQGGTATESHPYRTNKCSLTPDGLVVPTRRRKAKEDEADGVSLLNFAFHPPSPYHQTKLR